MPRDAEFQEILETIDIEYWLDREGVDYKHRHGSRGEQFNIRDCPFCGNSGFKVYMNAETGLGNCFHGDCERTFNLFAFVKAHLGDVDFATVSRHLREVAREQGWRPKKKRVAPVEIERSGIVLPPSFALPIDGRNLVYLRRRGVDAELADYFGLHYCKAGLYRFKKANGHEGWQDFSKRILFPVYDLEGELQTFIGRDVTGKAERKYLFPSGLPGTARFLYNGHNAHGAKRVVVGEGTFDVIALKRALDERPELRAVAPVGTFGKHLSHLDHAGQDQLGAFRRLQLGGLEEVTILWDGEPAAWRDAVKAAQLLSRIGLTARVGALPPGKDPDESDAHDVRQAFLNAEKVTLLSAPRLLMRNPYSKS